MQLFDIPSAFVIAFLVSTTLMLVLPPVARATGWIDRPGGRKTHEGEVPVIGGIAMFSGLLVSVAFSTVLGRVGYAIVASAALMVLVGAIDDRFNLSPYARLVAHLTAAVSVVLGTGYVVPDLGDLFGFGLLSLGPFDSLFTVVACIALINAFNMLDGLDGLAGGVGLLAFLGLGILALGAGAATSSLVSSSLCGAIAGFLIFNVPASFNKSLRVFMGDSGSTLLGFTLSCVCLTMVQHQPRQIEPVLTLWLLPLPVLELFSSTFRRLAKGQSPMKADSSHFHHRLQQAGFSVRQIFLLYFGATTLSVITGVAAYWANVSEPVLFYGFLCYAALWLTFVRHSAPIAAWINGRQSLPAMATLPFERVPAPAVTPVEP